MNIAIFQINPDRDENNVAFLSYENLERFQGSAALRSEIYDKVFEGEVECGTLEEVYQMFNLDHPDGYRGRSLSVSDVVEVVGEEKSTFYFCDSIGFREVDFDPDMTEPLKEKKIKVVLCEPGKVARVAEIGTELSDLQRVVGGLIEPYYPFEEQVCIVCNDEGKYNGMRPCRAIYGEGREMMDIIFGPFFIRGERPIRDLKYDILHHPNVALTTDGSAPAYTHGEDTRSIASMAFSFDKKAVKNAEKMEAEKHEFLLYSEEELEELLDEKEKKDHEEA